MADQQVAPLAPGDRIVLAPAPSMRGVVRKVRVRDGAQTVLVRWQDGRTWWMVTDHLRRMRRKTGGAPKRRA